MTPDIQIVVVCSHRGGAWKSSVSAGLALELARGGIAVVIVDPAKAGGLSTFDSPDFRGLSTDHGKGRSHDRYPLSVVHLPEVLSSERPGPELRSLAMELGAAVVIVDLPTAASAELASLLRDTHVAIATVPVDAVSFRALPPFLELLKEQRTMPGRSFAVRAAIVGAEEQSPRMKELGRVIGEHLQPILLRACLPVDEEYGALIASGSFPPVQDPGTPMALALEQLEGEVRSILSLHAPVPA